MDLGTRLSRSVDDKPVLHANSVSRLELYFRNVEGTVLKRH